MALIPASVGIFFAWTFLDRGDGVGAGLPRDLKILAGLRAALSCGGGANGDAAAERSLSV